MKNNHWADIGESTFVAGTWFLYWVYRMLGRIPFRFLLYPVVSYYWLSRPIARRSSMEYLQRLHATRHVFSKQPGMWQGYLHFIQYGEALLDKLLAIGGNYPEDKVDYKGCEVIWEYLAGGKGCLIVTTHMGCIELMQSASTRKNRFKVNILVHTVHASRFNRILKRINPDFDVNFLQVTAFNAPTAMLLADRLSAGEVIAIAGDRIPTSGDRVVYAGFLGKQAPFPAGPYLIASILACPVYAMACIRNDSVYRLKAEKLSDGITTPRIYRNTVIEEQVNNYAYWLEQRVVDSPFEWFNFFPFWDQVVR